MTSSRAWLSCCRWLGWESREGSLVYVRGGGHGVEVATVDFNRGLTGVAGSLGTVDGGNMTGGGGRVGSRGQGSDPSCRKSPWPPHGR